ncbi:MAG TPA: hypothetical protein VIL07_08505 [Symbiobacteriaceae bacterium]
MSLAKVIPIHERRGRRVGRRRRQPGRRRFSASRWFRSSERFYWLLAGLVGGLTAGTLISLLVFR